MDQPRSDRRLAAILAADMVGYSRLMEADEEGTLAALKSHQHALIDPKIKEHRGRVIKSTGDGVLVEFVSVVDAINCAVAIQRGMGERNADVPAAEGIQFRIGINLGDVIHDERDVFGDGVNIAARLEGLAEPGGICVSRSVRDPVGERLGFIFEDMGEQILKNISAPVHAYRVRFGEPEPKALRKHAAPWPTGYRKAAFASIAGLVVVVALVAVAISVRSDRSPSRPADSSVLADQYKLTPTRLSLVVLPFTNLSGDPAQDYVADVITEELTTALSRIAGSLVIARSTAMTYKDKPIDVREIGRDLGVRYALEGSAQRSAGRVRVTVQLIDTERGGHLWADQFDANRTDLLEMQDEIVKRLSSPLEIRLVDVDAARLGRTPPGNVDAQDLALQCMAGVLSPPLFFMEYNPAFGFCERSLQIDGSNAIALTFLALRYITPVLVVQSLDSQSAIRRADELASRALVADRNFHWAHLAKASVLIAQKRPEEAISELEEALVIDPGYADLCEANNYLGRPQKCLEYADKAIRLSPRDPLLGWFYAEKGWALLMLQQDDQAIEWVRRSLSLFPDVPIQQALLASALALTGRQAEARTALKHYLAMKGTTNKTVAQFRAQHRALSDNPKWLAYSDRLVEGLRRAGMPQE